MNEENTKSFQDSLYFALNLFNDQKWYEAHDAFEDIFLKIYGILLTEIKDKLFKEYFKYQFHNFT